MPVLQSRLDTRAEQYQKNRQEMFAKLELLDELYEQAAQGGGEEAMARLKSRDKMPVRERVAHVLDPDSPFLEISPLAAWHSHFTIGSGFTVGVGVIEDVECVILGHDPSVQAGAMNHFNSKKLMRGLEIARENRLPYVQFVESAGADLRGGGGRRGGGERKPMTPEEERLAFERGVAESLRGSTGHFAESGRLFYEITELSKMRIPDHLRGVRGVHGGRGVPARDE